MLSIMDGLGKGRVPCGARGRRGTSVGAFFSFRQGPRTAGDLHGRNQQAPPGEAGGLGDCSICCPPLEQAGTRFHPGPFAARGPTRSPNLEGVGQTTALIPGRRTEPAIPTPTATYWQAAAPR